MSKTGNKKEALTTEKAYDSLAESTRGAQAITVIVGGVALLSSIKSKSKKAFDSIGEKKIQKVETEELIRQELFSSTSKFIGNLFKGDKKKGRGLHKPTTESQMMNKLKNNPYLKDSPCILPHVIENSSSKINETPKKIHIPVNKKPVINRTNSSSSSYQKIATTAKTIVRRVGQVIKQILPQRPKAPRKKRR